MDLLRDRRISAIAMLLISCYLLQVSKCQSDGATGMEEASDLRYVGDEAQVGDLNLSPAPGVDAIYVFPKNSARLVAAGEDTELLVGLKNDGLSTINVIGIRASLHLPYDHSLIVQNLTGQAFNNATVPASAQATFPYTFAVSRYLQAGTFDLKGVIIYETDERPFQSTFFNGTIEVVDASDFLTMETVLLATFGIAGLGLICLWVHNQISILSKKRKKPSKVEVGTAASDASLDEWLEGITFTQSKRAKKKNK